MFNLVVGWLLMYALYVVYVRGYSSPEPARVARFEYRRKVGGRFGLLPPSLEPVGIALWALTAAGFVAAIVFFLIGDRFVGISSAIMLLCFLLTLWRDDQWIKRQPDYRAEIAALAGVSPVTKEDKTNDQDERDAGQGER